MNTKLKFRSYILLLIIVALSLGNPVYAEETINDSGNIGVSIMLVGTGSQNGQMTFRMDRKYINETDAVQEFRDRISFPDSTF